MASLTNIADRFTPSVPIELTFGQQPIATGTKQTTIFGHMASTPGSGLPYQVYDVINVGDATSAQIEVDALAGAGSQIGEMVYAFVNANILGGFGNFPQFRVVFIPHGVNTFGPSGEAITAVKHLRTDLFISCYPGGDATNAATLLNLVTQISGIDRDLSGQFGSFMVLGSIDPLVTQIAYNFNSRYVMVATLPDSNTGLVDTTATTTSGSPILTVVASVTGVYLGATVTGTGIPVDSVILSFTSNTITLDQNATASGTLIAIAIQNKVSQAPEIVASVFGANLMSSVFPYMPMNGVVAGGLIKPQIASDWITIDPNGASEAALTAGLSPLVIQPAGTVAYLRTRTTYVLNNLIPVTAYFDWQDLVIMNDFREDIFLITQNPPFNGNPGGTKASLTTAQLLLNELVREAMVYEQQGAFQGVQTLTPQFVVQASSTSRGRFDFYIPINVIPGLMVIAGNVQGVSNIGNFTL
jgi:phage tail sheath gpL-like